MKLAVEYDDGEQKRSFKANLRSKRDSVIWMSISPALGVEVMRLMITPDSLKLISKIPGDKYYYEGSIDKLNEMAQSELSFYMIQDLLVGNAIGLEQGEDKYKSRVDEQQYNLISKYNRKIKKVVGADEKDTSPDDSLYVEIPDKKYERLKRRGDETEFLVKRYWFNGYSYALERSVFDDLYNQRSVIVEHNDYKDYMTQSYPELTRLIINSAMKRQQVEIEINRLKTNKEYEFPFDIPEDFERKTKL
ncbi:MAG: DUF4292 domain-containing protein [Flavobacteriales bacterium]